MPRVAATCGCFDILHDGHISILQACRCLGDEVVVFLNSDASINRLKGDHKPVLPFEARAALLSAIRYVDAVIPFHEDTPDEAVKKYLQHRTDIGIGEFFWLKPALDYFKNGVDYGKAERDVVHKRGGIVLYYESPVKRSSSDIIERIKRGENSIQGVL